MRVLEEVELFEFHEAEVLGATCRSAIFGDEPVKAYATLLQGCLQILLLHLHQLLLFPLLHRLL